MVHYPTHSVIYNSGPPCSWITRVCQYPWTEKFLVRPGLEPGYKVYLLDTPTWTSPLSQQRTSKLQWKQLLNTKDHHVKGSLEVYYGEGLLHKSRAQRATERRGLPWENAPHMMNPGTGSRNAMWRASYTRLRWMPVHPRTTTVRGCSRSAIWSASYKRLRGMPLQMVKP